MLFGESRMNLADDQEDYYIYKSPRIHDIGITTDCGTCDIRKKGIPRASFYLTTDIAAKSFLQDHKYGTSPGYRGLQFCSPKPSEASTREPNGHYD